MYMVRLDFWHTKERFQVVPGTVLRIVPTGIRMADERRGLAGYSYLIDTDQ